LVNSSLISGFSILSAAACAVAGATASSADIRDGPVFAEVVFFGTLIIFEATTVRVLVLAGDFAPAVVRYNLDANKYRHGGQQWQRALTVNGALCLPLRKSGTHSTTELDRRQRRKRSVEEFLMEECLPSSHATEKPSTRCDLALPPTSVMYRDSCSRFWLATVFLTCSKDPNAKL
jgi:hypothetical protein